MLFNIALEGVFRSAGLDHDIRGTILYRSFQFLGFADDIDTIGRTGRAKAGRIRWLGHVLKMPNSCPTKKVFDSDPRSA